MKVIARRCAGRDAHPRVDAAARIERRAGRVGVCERGEMRAMRAMRASERARAREREVGGHRASRDWTPRSLRGAGAPSAPRRTARPSAFAAASSRPPPSFPAAAREEEARVVGSQQNGDESGRVRLCLYLISLWRPRCRSRRRAALRLLFGRHLSAAIKPRAVPRARTAATPQFWPEGGEVRKFGLAIMAADRLLY